MSLKEILKNAKRGEKYNLRCPICGGKQIYRLNTYEWLFPSLYSCGICGYLGYFLIDVSESKDDKVSPS